MLLAGARWAQLSQPLQAAPTRQDTSNSHLTMPGATAPHAACTLPPAALARAAAQLEKHCQSSDPARISSPFLERRCRTAPSEALIWSLQGTLELGSGNSACLALSVPFCHLGRADAAGRPDR
ncbi:hypothetical protein NDU88_005592 [Pleurodeles waltl]|uniref:Uncharacterized protein n=1 Tax=Pleurodeles waltl TaxID=8319 RepID=A0AAV7TBT9_PLEWA|nr:hypothetical protein NDU88_005592 [Pleurodeles waltl]